MNESRFVEFTGAILAHLLYKGYKSLKVENLQKYSIIEPIRDLAIHESSMANNNAYIIPIGEHQAYELTKKVLQLDMNFYIDVKFIQ